MISTDDTRVFFEKGETRSYKFRLQQLKQLRKAILKYETAIMDALYKDLHKSREESYATEIGFLLSEITHTINWLKEWMRPQKVSTPLVLFPSRSKILRDPFGIILIISPWNYPFQLCIAPLIGAIAAGNCTVLKPSEVTVNTAIVIHQMISEFFPKDYISVVEGDGALIIPGLIEHNRFDYIFFTGSIPVGKTIARLAAEQLIPTTLELGGKSPCIVDNTVDIKTTADRIVWGKFTNAGQTCVAPDYLLCHKEVQPQLIAAMQSSINKFYTSAPGKSPDYGRIVNEKHFTRLQAYLSLGKLETGGGFDKSELYIEPAILTDVNPASSIMQEEIFGPILPVLTYNTKEEALAIIKRNPNPLSLYVFSKEKPFQKYFTDKVSFGGGCINNTIVHLCNAELPFGGVSSSGSGQYHGRYTYETFSRPKSILTTPTWFDPAFKYPPYKGKLGLLKWLMK